MEAICLRIGDKVFECNKKLLCEYSDYFRAMFSGNYVESEKQEIGLEMLDPTTMSIVLNYMERGTIELAEHPLTTISEITTAATFLQITKLCDQIRDFLEAMLDESNWLEIMVLAQSASYTQLEQNSAAYGLYYFNSMKPEYISTIKYLVWYLCHPYLCSQNELDVFKFGFNWLLNNQMLEDTVLILACLDMKKLTNKNLKDIMKFLNTNVCGFTVGSVLEIVDCLLELTSKTAEISEPTLREHKSELCDKFSESVWSHLLSMVTHSRARLVKYDAVVPMRLSMYGEIIRDWSSFDLYTFDGDEVSNIDEDEVMKYCMRVENKRGSIIAAWGLTKVVVVCGVNEFTNKYIRNINVYDMLKKTWTELDGQQIPPRSYAGVTVVGDLLYIVGGEDDQGSDLDTAVVYDLKHRSVRNIAYLPFPMSYSVICAHNNKVYVSYLRTVYCHEIIDNNDYWKTVVHSGEIILMMSSFNDYIYCYQYNFKKKNPSTIELYRFRPGTDSHLHLFTAIDIGHDVIDFHPRAMISSGDCLLLFISNQNIPAPPSNVIVLVFKGEDEKPTVYTREDSIRDMFIVPYAGTCTLVTKMPPLCTELPTYHRQYLMQHSSRDLSL